jgi:hypothetical protein
MRIVNIVRPGILRSVPGRAPVRVTPGICELNETEAILAVVQHLGMIVESAEPGPKSKLEKPAPRTRKTRARKADG